MPRCLLALGANLGDAAATLRWAAKQAQLLKRSRLLARSNWHKTVPVGGPMGQNSFLNGALLLDTDLEPIQLLELTSSIEQQAGRQRAERWGARTLDVDLLLYDELACETDRLVLPHPRMSFRRFVLEPAVEIVPEMVHPDSGWTLAGLLSQLRQGERTVAVTAPCRDWAFWLARWLGGVLNCPVAAGFSTGDSLSSNSLWLSAIEFPSPESLITPTLLLEIDPRDPPRFSQSLHEQYDLLTECPPESTIAEWAAADFRKHYGPRARIRSDDPATIQQEALAAVAAAWPEFAPATIA